MLPNPRFKSFKSVGLVLAATVGCLLPIKCHAQGPGGPGGQAGAPAFVEEKLLDKMWESGGPRLSGLRNGKVVKAVKIRGNQSVSPHKIESLMQTRVNRVYDERQLQADLHQLYKTELFRKVTPYFQETRDGIIVTLDVVENPIVTDVIFHGNTRLEDRMLDQHCGISKGDPVNMFSVDMAKQRLIDLYHEKGMNQASIRVREGNEPGDRRVFFEIYEGPVERIWSINFVGNQFFSSSVLKTKIKSKSARGGMTAYLFNVAKGQQIEEDANIIVAFYRSLGFFQARADVIKKYHPSGNYLDLTFVVDEGVRSIIQDISIVGNKYAPFTTEVLMKALETKVGEPFNLARMQRDVRRLRNDYYGREGFVFVDIVPSPTFLEDPGKINLVFDITEGDRYRAGEINVQIQGDSSHTKQSVVMNMLGLREGEWIDLAELEKAEFRLNRSQIFETNPAFGEPPSVTVRSPDQAFPR
ncbi:MAG TPA: hypothetical protein DDW52_21080 [Planctomycetaceae bacterium]|nr:hypothetical protein [Planctomycetaceae bacterium]